MSHAAARPSQLYVCREYSTTLLNLTALPSLATLPTYGQKYALQTTYVPSSTTSPMHDEKKSEQVARAARAALKSPRYQWIGVNTLSIRPTTELHNEHQLMKRLNETSAATVAEEPRRQAPLRTPLQHEVALRRRCCKCLWLLPPPCRQAWVAAPAEPTAAAAAAAAAVAATAALPGKTATPEPPLQLSALSAAAALG